MLFSRRSFLAWLPAFLGGVAVVPRPMEAAESEPPSLPMTARERFFCAFAARLDWCCRRQGKTLDDVTREVGQLIGRRIRPGWLIAMCCADTESTSWIQVTMAVAEVLHVSPSWLSFGEGTAVPAPRWAGAS